MCKYHTCSKSNMSHTSSTGSHGQHQIFGDSVEMVGLSVPVTQAHSSRVQSKCSVNNNVAEGVALVVSLRSNSSLPSKIISEIVSFSN